MISRTAWRLAIIAALAAWGVLFWLVAIPAQAQNQDAPARAVIDCGSLDGAGSVLVIVGDRHLRVMIECRRA